MDSVKQVTKQPNYFNWFIAVLMMSVVIKLIIAHYFPLTGDEAYFALWGKYVALGYYDHTPLIGWILYPLVHLSHANMMLRLPTIIVTSAVGIGIYLFLKHDDKQKAALIAILFLISPISLLGVLITTDTPLLLFSFLSGIFLCLAVRHEKYFYYMLSGLCLGLAFFSKYFAVLLGLAYLCYFLFSNKRKEKTFGFILLFLCVLPFGLINLYWNYTHAWANILFNLYTRNERSVFHLHTILLYLLVVVYVLTPPIFYYFCKYWKQLFRKPKLVEFSVFIVSLLVPLGFFLLLSSVKSIGLHWPLAFAPFAYLLTFIFLSHQEIVRSLKFMIGFTGLHLIVLAIILMMPLSGFQKIGFRGHKYADLVFIVKHQAIRDQLKPYENRFVIASPSYAKAVLMTVDSGVYSPTFGRGSVHGRQGDFLTDYKKYDQKNFVILLMKQPKLKKYTPYFNKVTVKDFHLFNAKYYLVFGYQFNYPKYRNEVLRVIYQRYWQVPTFLPHASNFYCEKYFSQEGC